ncbi:tRNA epoxyqueuosine(34) reductase QueG [Mangrovibacillus cuniculi]|uniref:tRNA epoxyqueuosine(34) reductase QueG n=1 Tax=Mangrovibacillus cuniculi TaxID=2593652 RepID=A0A7S8HET7_9BACI|nr:tRNA epoxyqueuosine(34) reductase QueG [Mangrovibacillus cuniculi]QPC45816.1 tRNA epoxyqueuosine(34) reductase QueG [Mangrovibacillus cuniculi]
MNTAQLKKEIQENCRNLGIDLVGFAAANPFGEMKNRLIRFEELGHASGFEEKDIEKRTNPSLIFDDTPKSIISIAVAYPNKMSNAPKGKKGERRGIFARASWGQDYHTVLRDRLCKLEQFISERYPSAVMRSMVDTGELVDRAVAERAGVGWSAKNCSIITEEFGSYVYLGEMITNIPFEEDEPIMDQCGSCRKCIDACPTGALVGVGGQLNAQKCISFLTQTKSFLPEEYMKKIGNRLYGCDTCQTVCPKNKGINATHQTEFHPDPERVKPLLEPLLFLSNKEFKELYGEMSGAWRGKKPIQRNALIALGNFKEVSTIPSIQQVLWKDPRNEIRATAAWALGEMKTEESKGILLEAIQKEKDELVCEQIELALRK